MLTEAHYRDQGSDAVLELTVLGGVDERVDDAVGELQPTAEVEVPALEVDNSTGQVDNTHQLHRAEADDEPTAHHQ